MSARAIISDIHGNLEALTAVLADIEERDVDEIYCLGDVVGYGPNPRECLELVMEHCRVILKGNHEQAILSDEAANFNPRARRAIMWTAKELFEHNDDDESERTKRKFFIESLFEQVTLDEVRYFHASPRDYVREYILPTDITNRDKMSDVFDRLNTTAFVGHTHLPGVFTPTDFSTPSELMNVYLVTGDKALVNVGSVGQPRDRDVRSSYVTYEDDGTVVFRRVEYDPTPTIEKIYSEPQLDNFLGDRLLEGK